MKLPSKFNSLYIFGIYRNSGLSDGISDCLLTTMASVQSTDTESSLSFVEHCKWLNSVRPMKAYGSSAYNFSILFGCEQLVYKSTHVVGGCLCF